MPAQRFHTDKGGKDISLFNEDIKDWTVTFADTRNWSKSLHRLIRERKLIANKYTGFWKAMDTFKDKKAMTGSLWGTRLGKYGSAIKACAWFPSPSPKTRNRSPSPYTLS